MNRREFMTGTARVAVSGGLAAGGLALLARSGRRNGELASRLGEPGVLRPPGARADEAEFLSLCIRCQRCQDACGPAAIRLAGPEDPYPNGTPIISATDAACNLCLSCTRVCPTDALQEVEAKQDVAMGLAVVDERTCVSHNGTGVCGACHTACPFRNAAITQGLHNAPTVHAEHCVGCGLCEESCIVDGIKAIRVFSNRPTIG